MTLPLDIRRDDDGSLDEIVCEDAYVHLERRDEAHWWLIVKDAKTGRAVHVNFVAIEEIIAKAEEE